MVGIVVVSHSRALARSALALAEQMLPGHHPPIEIAAGLDDDAFGTDAGAVAEAITRADRAADGSGVVVLMDLGSAVLSADLALDLLDDAVRERVLLSPGPLVEGLVLAAVTASTGAGRDEVATAAAEALRPKASQLGGRPAAESPAPPAAPSAAPPAAPSAASGQFSGDTPGVSPEN